MTTLPYTKEQIKKSILGKLQRYYGKTLKDATPYQKYYAVASTLRDQIMDKWVASEEIDDKLGGKRVYYMSIEFLLGRAMFNNALNLLSTKEYTKALTELEISWKDIVYEEPEPGLGNGGLGRLAACFMDSLATLDLPAMGSTIRYEYGLFRQKISGGQQMELPDDWLQNGNVWEMARMEDVVEVHFEGKVVSVKKDGRDTFQLTNYRTVEAVPYDMPVVGYGNTRVNSLRTWRARSKQSLDFSAFSNGDYVNATKEK